METISDKVQLFRETFAAETVEQYRKRIKHNSSLRYINSSVFPKMWLNELLRLPMPWAPHQSADLMKPLRLVYSKPGFLRLTTAGWMIPFHDLLQHQTSFHQPCITPDKKTAAIWC